MGSKPAREVKFATINIPDELRTKDGSIVECHMVNDRWNFVCVRNDREDPNVKVTKLGKFGYMRFCLMM